MRKILITGGAGFIGSNFIRFLYREGRKVDVTVLDKLTYAGNLDNLREFMGRKGFRFVRGDICNARILDGLLPGVDAVYNFAAETHVDRSILEAGSFVKTDVLGTYVLLQRALKVIQDRKDLLDNIALHCDIGQLIIALDAFLIVLKICHLL